MLIAAVEERYKDAGILSNYMSRTSFYKSVTVVVEVYLFLKTLLNFCLESQLTLSLFTT